MEVVMVILALLTTAPPEPSPTFDKFRVHGPLHIADVKKVISEQKSVVSACYRKGLAQDATLAGQLKTSWMILADGSTKDFAVHKGSMQSVALQACIEKAVAAWKFPEPHGANVLVTYPFNFGSRVEKIELTNR